ncbi:MAG: ATP-binding protein [Chitinophagaceae bacterium]
MNAIKYSYTSSVIEVKANQEDGRVFFSVKDDGPGIDAVYLPGLFGRYFQVPGYQVTECCNDIACRRGKLRIPAIRAE